MIETAYRVVCNQPGCLQAGPLGGSRVQAWRLARDMRGFALHRSTAAHFCPRHSTSKDSRD